MPREPKGLTLIELLIIVVMIGILLTITYQKFTGGPDKRVRGTLRDDLAAVRTAESNYFAQHNSYGNRAQLDSTKVLKVTAGNTLTITATATGYTAVARNETDGSHLLRCSIDMSAGESSAASVQPVCNL